MVFGNLSLKNGKVRVKIRKLKRYFEKRCGKVSVWNNNLFKMKKVRQLPLKKDRNLI